MITCPQPLRAQLPPCAGHCASPSARFSFRLRARTVAPATLRGPLNRECFALTDSGTPSCRFGSLLGLRDAVTLVCIYFKKSANPTGTICVTSGIYVMWNADSSPPGCLLVVNSFAVEKCFPALWNRHKVEGFVCVFKN